MTDHALFGNMFISAGAMKAGTTWLYAVMQRHPELHFSCEKEIHYFYHRYMDPMFLNEERRLSQVKKRYIDSINPAKGNIDRVRLNLQWSGHYLSRPVNDYWYAGLFAEQRKQTYRCDFSNLYALLPVEAWQHIEANSNKLRVLYTLRHPMKRLWSHLKFHLEVSNQLESLETWKPADFEEFMRRPFMWDNAEYGKCLRTMREGLSEGNLKTIFFEDMHDDQRGMLSDLEDYLEIPDFKYPQALLNRQVNKSKEISMPDFFKDIFAKDVARIGRELEDQGLTLPASWSE